ncbi:polyprenyl synthetase family protein [soil metagenome]
MTSVETTDCVIRFKKDLGRYQKLIDADIQAYAKHVRRVTLQQYGEYARLEVDAYLSILERGGKRIRGALTILGYEMSGGTDQKMIIEAARVIEMIHAYILIIDDIHDRSEMRRGGPSAHVQLAQYHKSQHFSQQAEHFGVSIALNGALSGAHAAQMILANLQTDEDARLKVISILNRTMSVTAHGQTYDIMNEVVSKVSEADVDKALEWKTAHYTFLNPLHVGMVLAGADCHATDAITDYAMHAGRAFQLTDDLLGTFGTEFDSGKSPMDDIREGKRTLLSVHALEHTTNGDKNFIIQMLGNQHLTQAEFERCQDIIKNCGAYDYTKQSAEQHVARALASLQGHDERWSKEGIAFLRGLVSYLPNRTS